MTSYLPLLAERPSDDLPQWAESRGLQTALQVAQRRLAWACSFHIVKHSGGGGRGGAGGNRPFTSSRLADDVVGMVGISLLCEIICAPMRLVFTEAGEGYDISREAGSLAVATGNPEHSLALCRGEALAMEGLSSCAFTLASMNGRGVVIGMARLCAEVQQDTFDSCDFWGVLSGSGKLIHTMGRTNAWEGMRGYGQDDRVELCHDADEGSLMVKKSGQVLGTAAK